MKGPEVLGPRDHRPYVRLSDETHPVSTEEPLYTAVITTRRSIPMPLTDDDFASGGRSEVSYADPWTSTVLRHADVIARTTLADDRPSRLSSCAVFHAQRSSSRTAGFDRYGRSVR